MLVPGGSAKGALVQAVGQVLWPFTLVSGELRGVPGPLSPQAMGRHVGLDHIWGALKGTQWMFRVQASLGMRVFRWGGGDPG